MQIFFNGLNRKKFLRRAVIIKKEKEILKEKDDIIVSNYVLSR